MGQARSTFERRQLGLTLRRLREGAGVTQLVAAEALGKVRSRVIALEDGTATASQEDLEKLLVCYGIDSVAEFETVLLLGAHARKRQKRRAYVDVLPDAYQRFADLEGSAEEIHSFETGVVPGLLQSESYVRAVHAECDGIWWPSNDVEWTDRIAFRAQRQERIFGGGDPPALRFVVTEDALRATVARPGVMGDQLRHLLALLGEHRDLAVRVLRNDVPGNPARGNNLTVFRFGDRGAPVGFSSAALGPSTYYDEPEDTAAMLRAFHRVWELALSRKESRSLIERIAEEM